MPQRPDDATARFMDRLAASLADGSFVRLRLGRPHGTEPSLEKLLARRIVLRGTDHLSFVWRHRSKDITKNLPLAPALDEVRQLIDRHFHHAHLQTREHDIQLVWARRQAHWGLRIGRLATASAPLADADAASETNADDGAHDRHRQRLLALDTPFLAELGITDGQHRLVPAMARKWRQINKFVEVLAHAYGESPLAERDPRKPVRVMDFGAGKGYLTFAVHHHLRAQGLDAQVSGIELRPDLTAAAQATVSRLGLQGLEFVQGDVRSHPVAPADIMIALHACDTATDVAMHRGVRAGAAVILCSPCCHKELRPQMVAPPVLAPMLAHGIHMAEQAEMLTDALRALLLRAEGWDTRVFEFISPEHTQKNKMVLAVRRRQALPLAQRQAVLDQVDALMAHYGIRQHTLQRLLAADAAGPASPNPPAAAGAV